MTSENEKLRFMIEECWLLTIQGAFQRAMVYSNNATQLQRRQFRKTIKEELNEAIKPYKATRINGNIHSKNIEKLCDTISRKYQLILVGRRFRIGIGQKLLNLYLKYLWCLGVVQEPPHCPIDRTIIESLQLKSATNWTELDDIVSYNNVISEITKLAQASKVSVAVWELNNFRRRELQD